MTWILLPLAIPIGLILLAIFDLSDDKEWVH